MATALATTNSVRGSFKRARTWTAIGTGPRLIIGALLPMHNAALAEYDR